MANSSRCLSYLNYLSKIGNNNIFAKKYYIVVVPEICKSYLPRLSVFTYDGYAIINQQVSKENSLYPIEFTVENGEGNLAPHPYNCNVTCPRSNMNNLPFPANRQYHAHLGILLFKQPSVPLFVSEISTYDLHCKSSIPYFTHIQTGITVKSPVQGAPNPPDLIFLVL